jgi:dihydrodipicolinate synthase/N-acetylneuraminate lyase
MNYIPKRGLSIPAITVIDDAGRVIAEEQRQVFRHLIQNGYGADVIFGVGTTGEWNRLANDERQRVMEIEVSEVRRANEELRAQGRGEVEAWVGINGSTRAEALSNLDAAIQLGADAAVIAPLAIRDLSEQEIVRFFHRDLTSLIEAAPRAMPVFLYDNADIAAGQTPHIRTRIVKDLSRLPWVVGIKVSAPRRVLGNYTKAALHFKQPGEFGIYIGKAMLIFDLYRPSHGFIGRLREGWHTYLLHDALPVGVVAGPGNALPREWQKAWRACWAGDEGQMDFYHDLCGRFEAICAFEENGRRVKKTVACLKYALELDGVISSSLVGRGTKPLSPEQAQRFTESYSLWRERVGREGEQLWRTLSNRHTWQSTT